LMLGGGSASSEVVGKEYSQRDVQGVDKVHACNGE
jgi:hypothetical protein